MGSELRQATTRSQIVTRHPFEERYDVWLIIASISLLAIGLIMVSSASVSLAERELGEPLYYFYRQGFFVLFGLCVGSVVLCINLQVWRRASPVLLLVGITLLALVLVPGIGKEVNGSVRWLTIGGFNLQPSELMKLFLAIYLAGYLVRRSEEVRVALSGFLKPITVLGIIAGLLLLEPDYGATVVLFAMTLGMMFLGGVPFITFVGWLSLAVVFLVSVVISEPYRLERLTTFWNPWADPFDSGWQLTAALIAIGRGEWFGVGLGNSVQKLFYLPEAHTDFLFAVLAEEFGLVGMCVVIALFSFIVFRAFAIGRRSELSNRFFEAHLSYGLGLLIGLQAFLNIGVNVGLLPTKGLALPLLSSGGSSLIVNCVAIALLLRIDHELRVSS